MNKSLSRQLHLARIAANFKTQAEIAHKIGVSIPTVQKIENQSKIGKVGFETVEAYAKAVGHELSLTPSVKNDSKSISKEEQ